MAEEKTTTAKIKPTRPVDAVTLMVCTMNGCGYKLLGLTMGAMPQCPTHMTPLVQRRYTAAS